MQADHAPGITRSLQKLAIPIRNITNSASVAVVETNSITAAPKKPMHAISLRVNRRLPVNFATRADMKPQISAPKPPKNRGKMASAARWESLISGYRSLRKVGSQVM